MEMDMQGPGDMCSYGWKEHEPAITERTPEKITGLHQPANHIIISYRSISYSF